MRAALFAVAALLAGCGGSPSPLAVVVDCLDPIMPRVHTCIPADYRGKDAAPLRPCVSVLALELRECRALGAGEFATYLDHRVGHEMARMIEGL